MHVSTKRFPAVDLLSPTHPVRCSPSFFLPPFLSKHSATIMVGGKDTVQRALEDLVVQTEQQKEYLADLVNKERRLIMLRDEGKWKHYEAQPAAPVQSNVSSRSTRSFRCKIADRVLQAEIVATMNASLATDLQHYYGDIKTALDNPSHVR